MSKWQICALTVVVFSVGVLSGTCFGRMSVLEKFVGSIPMIEVK